MIGVFELSVEGSRDAIFLDLSSQYPVAHNIINKCLKIIKNNTKFAAKLRRCSHIVALELNKWMVFDNIRDYLGEIPVRKIRADQITFEAQ